MSLHDLLQLATSRKASTTSKLLPAPIIDLVSKIENISSSVDINLSQNPLHKLGFENGKKDNHGNEDALTKLKNIENKSEINRAEVELMIQRKPKRYAVKNQKQDEHKESYMDIYKQLKAEKIFKEHKDTEFNSEDQISEPNQTPPRNIKHYSLLRQHPKILQFTLEKMKSRNSEQKLQSQKELEKTMINQASRPASLLFNEEFKEVIENMRKVEVDPLSSPKAIVDNQLTKFYSKSSRGKIDAKIRDNPRCNMFLQRQEEILMRAENNHVSKQNMKKLKQRLNGIVNEINKNDKNASKEHFPRLATSRQSSNIRSISITQRL